MASFSESVYEQRRVLANTYEKIGTYCWNELEGWRKKQYISGNKELSKSLGRASTVREVIHQCKIWSKRHSAIDCNLSFINFRGRRFIQKKAQCFLLAYHYISVINCYKKAKLNPTRFHKIDTTKLKDLLNETPSRLHYAMKLKIRKIKIQ